MHLRFVYFGLRTLLIKLMKNKTAIETISAKLKIFHNFPIT